MPTLTLQPDETAGIDTYINFGSPTFNYGVSTILMVGQVVNERRRSLLRFDISSIPAGATITSAILRLYCTAESTSTNMDVWASRSLVDWFEGSQNGAAPSGGQDGSTWNLRNANGSVAWAGGAGGAANADWVTTGGFTGGTVSITAASTFFDWNVTADVQGFYSGSLTNRGWWVASQSISTGENKTFASSSHSTALERPQLIIDYTLPDTEMAASLSGSGSLVGDMTLTAPIEAALAGSSALLAEILQPGSLHSTLAGQGLLDGELKAIGYMLASLVGTSALSGHLMSPVDIPAAHLTGSGSLVGDIKGQYDLAADLSGQGSVEAEGTFAGYMSASLSGAGGLIARGWAYAKNVVRAELCDFEPLFHITDGTYLNGGQRNILDLINPKNGFLLSDWNPNIAQYKEGGVFSDSPFAPGRRLVRRVFANAIEVLDLKVTGYNQNNLIRFVREMFAWQELAADYWTGDFSYLPVYLVARGPSETETRYAIIHTMSCPELSNPYAQPLFTREGKATIERLTLRIERGDWTDTPPGQFECVNASSSRSWTVAGWQTGGA